SVNRLPQHLFREALSLGAHLRLHHPVLTRGAERPRTDGADRVPAGLPRRQAQLSARTDGGDPSTPTITRNSCLLRRRFTAMRPSGWSRYFSAEPRVAPPQASRTPASIDPARLSTASRG